MASMRPTNQTNTLQSWSEMALLRTHSVEIFEEPQASTEFSTASSDTLNFNALAENVDSSFLTNYCSY